MIEDRKVDLKFDGRSMFRMIDLMNVVEFLTSGRIKNETVRAQIVCVYVDARVVSFYDLSVSLSTKANDLI